MDCFGDQILELLGMSTYRDNFRGHVLSSREDNRHPTWESAAAAEGERWQNVGEPVTRFFNILTLTNHSGIGVRPQIIVLS